VALLALDLLSRIVAMRVNPRPPYMGRLKSSANSWCFLFSCHSYWRLGGDRPPPDSWGSIGVGRSLDLKTKATRGGARFQVDDGYKKPTATSLYTVDPLDPNHDATMRIEGEAPKQQQPILFPGAETMGGRRATATSDRFLAVSSLFAPRCQNLVFLLPPVADYAAECSLKPSGMTPSFA
jgi:hypothetical protein